MQNLYGLEIPQTLEEVCDPKRLALLVYDMQAGILSQLPNGTQTVTLVTEVLQAARAAGVRVFFTRYMSLPKELAGVFQLRMAMTWQGVSKVEDVKPIVLRDSPSFELIPEVAPLPSEAIFDRITMSAFEGTPLNIALRDCGINAVALIGVALEVGIEPTVRHAADLGYIPVVIADACGGRDEPARQRSLTGLEFAGDAIITDVATITSHLRRFVDG